ncbi:hypothetical protein LCGC14_3053030 [marine sediment metagenome]|uniref:Uncharacterized protein n=1 Tax=marine sediment metagenome TaxID=412755 RepID=A0A0F8WL31_9ZZZZ
MEVLTCTICNKDIIVYDTEILCDKCTRSYCFSCFGAGQFCTLCTERIVEGKEVMSKES